MPFRAASMAAHLPGRARRPTAGPAAATLASIGTCPTLRPAPIDAKVAAADAAVGLLALSGECAVISTTLGRMTKRCPQGAQRLRVLLGGVFPMWGNIKLVIKRVLDYCCFCGTTKVTRMRYGGVPPSCCCLLFYRSNSSTGGWSWYSACGRPQAAPWDQPVVLLLQAA